MFFGLFGPGITTVGRTFSSCNIALDHSHLWSISQSTYLIFYSGTAVRH